MRTSRPSPRRPASPPAPSTATSPRRPSCSPRCWPSSRGRERDVAGGHRRWRRHAGCAAAAGPCRRSASRALKGRRLAYAMIVEPCEPEIDKARLEWRAALGEEFVRLIRMGQEQGAFRDCDPRVAAACVVGAFMEALVGPLAPEALRRCRGCAAPDRRDRRRLPGDRRQDAACASRRDREDGMSQVQPRRHARAPNQAGPATGGMPSATIACSSRLRTGGAMGEGEGRAARRACRRRGHAGAGSPRQPAHARAQNARPLRQPHRLGGVASGLARADGAGLRQRGAFARLDGARARRRISRGACSSYIWNQIEHGVGCPLGMTYAAFPGLAQPEFGGLAGEDPLDPLRQAPAAAIARKSGATHRLCHDREAGRLGPAADADDGAVRRDHQGRARLSAQRPQVVLLGAGVGRVLHAGAGGGRRVVLLRAGLPARRHRATASACSA